MCDEREVAEVDRTARAADDLRVAHVLDALADRVLHLDLVVMREYHD